MKFATQRDAMASQMFKNLGITSVEHLDMNHLADIFTIEIKYGPYKRGKVLYYDSLVIMLLNENLSIDETRRTFFHELSHHLNHYGRQDYMGNEFRNLQEIQAKWLSLYYAMPIHIFEPLLIRYKDPLYLAELFELPLEMVIERCESIKRERSRSEQYDIHTRKEFIHRMKGKSLQPGKVHTSTLSILNQLKNQVGEERMSYDVKRLLR